MSMPILVLNWPVVTFSFEEVGPELSVDQIVELPVVETITTVEGIRMLCILTSIGHFRNLTNSYNAKRVS